MILKIVIHILKKPFKTFRFHHYLSLCMVGAIALSLGSCANLTATPAAQTATYEHVRDVIYGRKHGMALTMDVLTPHKNTNGAAVIWIVSGGWFSSPEAISTEVSQIIIDGLISRGYTVFAVFHSSQPKFNIPEIIPDLHRAVRYVRFHAAEYQINPDSIGMIGASSGGHLALLESMNARDSGNTKAQDPIERISGRVQAVACFFPPTDFLNYGRSGTDGLGRGPLRNFPAPFNFHQADDKKRRQIGWAISPINHVTFDDPPTLIIHGDKDEIVPLQQSQIMIAKLKAAGIPNRLIIKPQAGHGWPQLDKYMPRVADWFDKYLLRN